MATQNRVKGIITEFRRRFEPRVASRTSLKIMYGQERNVFTRGYDFQ